MEKEKNKFIILNNTKVVHKTRLFVNSKNGSNKWNSKNRREIKIIGIP